MIHCLVLLAAAMVAPDERLTEPTYLYEVARHLYRWHLDERDVTPEIHRGEFVFWVREVHPALDEGDESRFGEVVLPHLGVHDRIHYAMGYCGSGICLASHFGNLLGRRLAGDAVGSAFDLPAFETRPLYDGRPWFLASAVRYYQFLDRHS